MESQNNLTITAKDREILKTVRTTKYGTVMVVIQVVKPKMSS